MAQKHKVKYYAIIAAKILGLFLGCLAFLWGVIEFMWLCYYAGIPM